MSLALICSTPAAELNPGQQLAVEHGIGEAEGPGPLLVIAGAGSGKTAMLAHRVAALILAGADESASCSRPSPAAPRRSSAGGSSGSSPVACLPKPRPPPRPLIPAPSTPSARGFCANTRRGLA